MNRWISITGGLIILAALIALAMIGPSRLSVDDMRMVLLKYGSWAVVISCGLMVGQAIVAPLPGNVITIANALVFGPVWGSLLSWFSMVLGSCLCFLLSKAFGRPFAHRFAGDSIHKIEDFFHKYGLRAIFLVRMMPLVPFDAVSYGAPIVGVPFTRFLVATSIGIIPSVLAYSYVGTLIVNLYWWVLVGLLGISLIGVIAATRAFQGIAATRAFRGITSPRPSVS
jgi:uncharacterized membrane protein YdjX (TVP38/TMEM64 family)